MLFKAKTGFSRQFRTPTLPPILGIKKLGFFLVLSFAEFDKVYALLIFRTLQKTNTEDA